jgi:hypothetical protein
LEDKMGLDMYAYVGRPGQMDEFYKQNDLAYNAKTGEFDEVPGGIAKPRDIAYWRKHPNLHGWMQRLWHSKGGTGDFNGDELELTWADIELLEQDINNKHLPRTGGFFFGDPADDYYREQDLAFIRNAKAELFLGLRVFYNSSW